MTDCLFCQIANGQTQTEIIYEDQDVTAFADINPQAPVHILIVPKKHLESVAHASEDDQLLLGKLMLAAKKIAEQLGVAEGFRLQVNNGQSAGQIVKHLHIHLLGGGVFL